ncbi:hypothetical protein [Salinivibrio sp. ML323]|uniref:hypothetical protein n=1 Tax=Salinivibrio sp. ML323 TaxID=1909474 RepID=UPI0013012DD0|nr:hypothetical protein [Salinivibrio sp. ML323]
MPIIITIWAARHPTLVVNLAPIVTGARWQFARIHHGAGACVIVANGTINV